MDANEKLARLQKAQEYNQRVADRILRELNKRRCHVRIYVSASGLRFEALDDCSHNELAKLGLSDFAPTGAGA